jgi:signal transduction histidine kinase
MAVLAVLAALQYRWLGQVSQAERQRMHETMTTRAQELAAGIDREIGRVYLTFQLRDADTLEQGLQARYKTWREASRHPDLIARIYVVLADGTLQAFDTASGALTPIEWPAELTTIRERARAGGRFITGSGGTTAFTIRLPQTISTDPLAVSVMLPVRRTVQNGVEAHVIPAGSVLVLLNQSKFVGEVVPQLVRQHLDDSLDEYRLSIVRTRAPKEVVYASHKDRALIELDEADIRVDALGLRPAVIERLLTSGDLRLSGFAAGVEAARAIPRTSSPAPPPPPAAPLPSAAPTHTPPTGRVTVVLEETGSAQPSGTGRRGMATPRAPGTGGGGTAMAGGGGIGSGAWQVLLKHRAGSLEAAVKQVRRRNLMMSFGMLALLAASVGLVLVSARRAERLASQQMDFVATVSHELRTPLAVIRSAGQNLAAGVVQDPKRYGELIETEGRRLTDMVEQTLALAGLSGERRPMAQHPVDAGDVARAVLASPETTARAAGVTFDVRIAEELPLVLADEMLLRRGVQNLVANALKYGAAGGWVGVTVDASGSRRGREVRITVSDKGPGVAPEDLPHIFDAFYRGRRAVADQVQGNGLGLHLVKRIAEAHGGRVTVRTAPGEGASFTIHIPSRADLALHPLPGEQPA